MDSYPSDYIEHNLPFIVLSGIVEDSEASDGSDDKLLGVYGNLGPVLSSEFPLVQGEVAEQLLQELQRADGSRQQWNSSASRAKGGLAGFKIKAVGRQYHLPSRKADPPALSPALEPQDGSPERKSLPQFVLHSPISPLTPGSPIYPDGVMSPLWIAKHQHHIPAAFVSFYSFTSDAARNSLNDNQLKNDINIVKTALYKSDYKTRYAVVLLGDKATLEASDLEERLGNIRRSTGLDPKTSFFFLQHNSSQAEIASFAVSILSALQPLCVEYYRDLTKHARRKKNRSTIPPPTLPPTRGTSQTLAALGWGVRYDFKLGVFAEFRQEMESACRHYTSALESLLGTDGVFETTASWSPRWDEARLLADIVAVRILRCLLWSGSTTMAVQSWDNYRERMRNLVDRRGKGSSNYGWEAWESRWAKMMAQLIQRIQLPVFSLDSAADKENSMPKLAIFSPPEKAFPLGERITPWHHLHHSGYWLRLAAKHAVARRRLAFSLPEDDRIPPGQSPASAMACRYGTYDTYMCPEPHIEYPLPGVTNMTGFDHSQDILSCLNLSADEFRTRYQGRMAERLQLDIGKEMMRARDFLAARDVLKTLWLGMTWRSERWMNLVLEVTRTLRECARLLGDVVTFVSTQYELHSEELPPLPNEQYDFMRCARSIRPKAENDAVKPSISLVAGSVHSFLSAKAVFRKVEVDAGDPLDLQITLRTAAQRLAAPVELSQVVVSFNLKRLTLAIHHEPDFAPHRDPVNRGLNRSYRKVVLRENPAAATERIQMEGRTDLSMLSEQELIMECSLILREPGEISIESIALSIDADQFELVYTVPPIETPHSMCWWSTSSRGLTVKKLGQAVQDRPGTVTVLPRPPKMEVRMVDKDRQYYTDEPITFNFEVANLEDEETESTVEVRLMSRTIDVPAFSWVPAGELQSDQTEGSVTASAPEVLPGHPVGRLQSGESSHQAIRFDAPSIPCDLLVEAKVLYHLLSEPDAPVSKTISHSFNVTSAFEANYEFTPRVHPEPWPTFFGLHSLDEPEQIDRDAERVASGITQRWRLIARIASFAEEGLVVEDVDLVLHSIRGDAVCAISKDKEQSVPIAVAPQELYERSFSLDVKKVSLEDRRMSTLSMSLSIKWRRADAPDSAPIASTLLMPDMVVPSSEPRVLATAYPSSNSAVPSLIHLDYVLENPTMHFLTFDLTMEASEEFAFSGPKFGAANLLPLSRTTVRFNILPLVKGAWISPTLKVMDRYFGKQLKVLGTDGMRVDKKGISIWVDVGEEDA